MDFTGRHVHVIGIGGAGLSAIARVLLEQGVEVSGSDLLLSPPAEQLARDGAQVFVGHRAQHVDGADVVVASSAVPEDNTEIVAARAAGIPVLHRAEFLGHMMADHIGVAVAGAHGKTTTTAMIATIVWKGGLDPTFIVGGWVAGLGTNARAGTGPHFIVEADEYDETFLGLQPRVAVVTNVEHDHPDCYPTFEEFRNAFERFVALLPPDGLLVTSWDDEVAREMGQQRAAQGQPVTFYGLGEQAIWRAEEVRPNFAGGSDFLAVRGSRTMGLVRLRVPGLHNVCNSLAALAVTNHLGMPFPTARSALTGFRGVGRRFEIKGEADGVTVVDDYAHNPTKIRAALSSAREQFPDQALWAVWQPHTYSRTRAFLSDFACAFNQADHVVVLPIYAAREQDTLGVSSSDVVAQMAHPDVRLVDSMEEAVVTLATDAESGDVVITLGAGDGNRVGEWLLAALSEEEEDDRDADGSY